MFNNNITQSTLFGKIKITFKIIIVLRNILLNHPRNEKVLAHKLNKIFWDPGYSDMHFSNVQVTKTIKNKAVENT